MPILLQALNAICNAFSGFLSLDHCSALENWSMNIFFNVIFPRDFSKKNTPKKTFVCSKILLFFATNLDIGYR